MNDINCWESKFKLCRYSARLLKRLYYLNKTLIPSINILEIKKAIYYAKKYHGKQKRDTGEFYYSHPIEVAYMVSYYLFDTNALVTSILHDVIEDTDLTKSMIYQIFGEVIADQVEDLTRTKPNRKISAAEIVTSLWLQKKEDLLLIKFFDRLHNMQSIAIKSDEKINKIICETVKYFILAIMSLRHVLPDMLLLEDALMNLCLQHSSKLLTNDLLIAYPEKLSFVDSFQLISPIFQNKKFLNNFLHESEAK